MHMVLTKIRILKTPEMHGITSFPFRLVSIFIKVCQYGFMISNSEFELMNDFRQATSPACTKVEYN